MNIIVISDTHMPRRASKLPGILMEELKGADLILHAGDWQTPEVWKELRGYAEVKGVWGNVDGPEMKELVSEKLLLMIEGVRIGVVHGHGKKGTTEKRALHAFENEEVDCIIFGHSHIPMKREEGGILLFNPGSPTDKRRQALYSFGRLTVSSGNVQAEHIFFNDKS
ncbi:metallophosphoesterase family protein [Peribacillus kribbensis]|uniref:metallophosphoesterase family protein n=1 Tax=Peribacillus kribbensis TaxID=356658 RepID=UPI00040A37E2|nr:metallophosphoesterase [Peribacillus kribbensis]